VLGVEQGERKNIRVIEKNSGKIRRANLSEHRNKWWAPGSTATSCAYLLFSLNLGNRTTVMVVAPISSEFHRTLN